MNTANTKDAKLAIARFALAKHQALAGNPATIDLGTLRVVGVASTDDETLAYVILPVRNRLTGKTEATLCKVSVDVSPDPDHNPEFRSRLEQAPLEKRNEVAAEYLTSLSRTRSESVARIVDEITLF